MEFSHKKFNGVFAFFIFAFVFISYLFVVAPTVCFWDCGEYTASCPSLGVPHPPGNPLYMVIGRVFVMLLFFFSDVGYRLNLISALACAVSSMLIYLTVIRVFLGFIGELDTLWKKITVYISGFVGALFGAYANTVLFCAVEAEVNSLLLVPVMLCTWLAMVWSQSNDAKRDRYLVLISYIAFLGVGIHMYAMIVVPPIVLYVVLTDKEKLKDWRFWLTCGVNGLVMYDMFWFIYLGAITAVVTLVMSISEKKNQVRWLFCFYLVFFALVGFSTHTYIPIRSALNPMIDENHPANWDAFQGFLQRKQYGSESMVTRAFWRLGSWKTQLGIEGHMGFGGFFLTQFYRFTVKDTQQSFFTEGSGRGLFKLAIYLIPLALMLYAMYFLYRKHKNVAIFLISLELITTLFLVFYMNFADGTKPERRDYMAWVKNGKRGEAPQPFHREVRIRDYFYVVGFMYYGMWMGIAAGTILYLLYTNRRALLRMYAAPMCSILFAASPALPMSQNLPLHNRVRDYIPFDYAYNLLMSCDKDAILFTNGDNDTFPLWALQEGYGIRKDVRIINLSLVNTDWYIKQLKHLEPKVAVSFSDDEIETLNHQANPFEKSFPFKLQNAGITVNLPDMRQRNAILIQDKMVLNVVDANNWKKPVYFSVTVSSDNFMGLGPYLKMEGLVYRILPQPVGEGKNFDIDRTNYFLDKVYLFRSMGEMRTSIDETIQNIVTNYAACFIQVALSSRQPLQQLKAEVELLRNKTAPDSAGKATSQDTVAVALVKVKEQEYAQQLDMIVHKMDQCISLIPWDWRPRMLLQEILVNHNRFAEAEKHAKEALALAPDNPEYLKMMVHILQMQGKSADANSYMKKLIEIIPDPAEIYYSLASSYESLKLYDSAVNVLKEFQKIQPQNKQIELQIARLLSLKNKPPEVIADSNVKTGSGKKM